MKNYKNILLKGILLISALKIQTYAYVTSELGKKCPTECTEVIDICLELNNINSSFQSYPPKEELGKCFCKDISKYLACLNCYYTKTNKNTLTQEQVTSRCKLVLGNTIDTPAAAGTAGTAGANAGTAANGAAGTANKGANAANNSKAKTTGTEKSATQTADSSDKSNENEKSKSNSLGIIIIGAVAAIGVVGYVFYSRKQKERPESMPFFGNSAASPNQYATLNTPKEMTESQNNLTADYNNQYYDVPPVDQNQYYNQGNNNYGYDQNQGYGNQYDQNYGYNNQYPSTTYENEIVGGAMGAGVAPTPGNYESRRESMMPNSQPTTTNVTGMYVVAYKYDPQLDDELELQVNDQVQIIEEYEDGWMKATNLTTGKQGMAPRVCIKEA
ncbi:hypothetical protein LY90DRAFT_506403 [Neocallimastix californiae]|jgi:hypothetical protein|uniref:SH3 domain-containing protein n=1 Tax=Neocallimastix californiae TaxID=1754190 RepID=A0A1Y2DEC5_9FUNG|nr:hypothetical protein LY90DRAFT_506403 [Neocallimastix californiae]|eukprot:ORY57618.1 hypothetical protein LY90DRAFT_506403 [Neocallimastix californiae]